MKKLMIFVVLLLVVGLVSSCGIRTSTSNYFYSPSWTRANSIIYIGQTSSSSKDFLGSQLSSSYTEWVKTIYPLGTGESSVLWDATDKPPYVMTCSPVTDYVAYGDDLRSGLYRTIVIRNISTGTHSGLDLVELAFNPGVKSFDWSNDGTRLVYCTTNEVRVVDVDGGNDTLVTTASSLEFVSWKNGGRIAFVNVTGLEHNVSLIYPDGSGRVNLYPTYSQLTFPQISAVNTNEVYAVYQTPSSVYQYTKVNVNTLGMTTFVSMVEDWLLPRLSPDATLVTYSKTDEDTGLYTFNLTTTSETQVK